MGAGVGREGSQGSGRDYCASRCASCRCWPWPLTLPPFALRFLSLSFAWLIILILERTFTSWNVLCPFHSFSKQNKNWFSHQISKFFPNPNPPDCLICGFAGETRLEPHGTLYVRRNWKQSFLQYRDMHCTYRPVGRLAVLPTSQGTGKHKNNQRESCTAQASETKSSQQPWSTRFQSTAGRLSSISIFCAIFARARCFGFRVGL